MKIISHSAANTKIAEVSASEILIQSADDGLDLLGNLYYKGFDKIILHEKNLTPDFFDLKNGMAGEILQKYSNYRVRLAIVGDFSKYSRKSIQAFIVESNRGGHVNFVNSVADALNQLSGTGK